MPCGDDMQTLLSRFVDGELSPEERAGVQAHLPGCESCRVLLGLFQKNESLLSNALASEAFGNGVIENVMDSLRRRPAPTEAYVVESNFGDWIRTRPTSLWAAAALLVVGFGVALIYFRGRPDAGQAVTLAYLKSSVDSARSQGESADAAYRELLQNVVAQQQQYEKLIRDMVADRALKYADQGSSLGYIEPNRHIVVRTKFDPKSFVAYDLYRRTETETDADFVKLNAKPLESPEFEDDKVQPGQAYLYKFVALRPNGEALESPLISMSPLPGEPSPDKYMLMHCLEIGARMDMALFVLEKNHNGKKVSERFRVSKGERIGGIRNIPGIGNVDFTTDLELSRMEMADQTLEVSYTAVKVDEKGQPVAQQIVGNRIIPATIRFDASQPLAARSIPRAQLRPAGSADTQSVGYVWKGGQTWVRTPGP